MLTYSLSTVDFIQEKYSYLRYIKGKFLHNPDYIKTFGSEMNGRMVMCLRDHGIGVEIEKPFMILNAEEGKFITHNNTIFVHKRISLSQLNYYGSDPYNFLLIPTQEELNQKMVGKSYCVTGDTDLRREAMAAFIEMNGGIFHRNLTLKTNYLIATPKRGDINFTNKSLKMLKAEANGTKVITEREFASSHLPDLK